MEGGKKGGREEKEGGKGEKEGGKGVRERGNMYVQVCLYACHQKGMGNLPNERRVVILQYIVSNTVK